MAVEKILARIMASLSAIYLIISIRFYPGLAPFAALFLVVFIAADRILPIHVKEEAKWQRIGSNILVVLLTMTAIVGAFVLPLLWKRGPFANFP